MLTIVQAQTPDQVNDVADLMREFVSWLTVRYKDRLFFIDGYFNRSAWERELASLSKTYAEPDGALLLALIDSQPAGCVALHGLEPGICEMKRLFVRPRFQGHHIGRALVTALIQQAMAKGYKTMRLDTGFRQMEAQALYRSLGFTEIEPYYESPLHVRERLVFMELDLTATQESVNERFPTPMAC
jgi:putative acetyltransferase